MVNTRYMKKSEEVHETISKLFARYGYHAASVRDIASQLNMNKSSLYHYIGSKEKALYRIMKSGIDKALETLGRIVAKDLPAEERLKEVLEFYTRRYCRDQERLILLTSEFKFLNENHRLLLIEKQKQVVNFFLTILKELEEEGKTKDINSRVAIFAFFGMAHYTVNWYNRDGPVGPEELAKNFVEIFTKGILK